MNLSTPCLFRSPLAVDSSAQKTKAEKMSEGRRRKSPLTAASSSSNEENGNGPEPMDETSDMKVDSGKVESAPEASTATSAAGEDAGLERASKRQKQEGDQEPSGK